VEKQGDKCVLKDDAGKTYDIDHQTDVAKFEGKRGACKARWTRLGRRFS